jgi:hypothetical protein
MTYGWQGNYETREKKARFTPIEGQPETVWPGRGFHADVFGGCDCVTGSFAALAAKIRR